MPICLELGNAPETELQHGDNKAMFLPHHVIPLTQLMILLTHSYPVFQWRSQDFILGEGGCTPGG